MYTGTHTSATQFLCMYVCNNKKCKQCFVFQKQVLTKSEREAIRLEKDRAREEVRLKKETERQKKELERKEKK